jgi:hypothetical protein
MDNNLNINFNGDFLGFLTLIFITLKLCHIIDWSWAWVLAPIWIPLSVVFVVGLIVLIIKTIFD